MKKTFRCLPVILAFLAVSGCMQPALPPETTAPSPSQTITTQPTDSQPTDATQNTEASQPTEPGPSAPTVPPVTEQPTVPPVTEEPTVPPVTEPPAPPADEYIGTLYTRVQLEAMSTKRISYGPGSTSDGKRPPYADSTQNKYGKYDAHFITQDAGCIYLTFDCGYEYFAKDENGKTYPVTSRILDTLKEKNVKAVFFITLPYAQKNPALVQRMIDEGHAVGNHSSTHPDMTTISIDQMVTEILTLHNYVLDNFHYKMHLFRPPTGAFSEQSLAVTQSLGYKTVDWSFAYSDWDPDQQPALDAAKKKVIGSAHSGAIYLLHAISVTNATILGDVIDSLRAEHYALPLFQ